jgi:hypothetical protein
MHSYREYSLIVFCITLTSIISCRDRSTEDSTPSLTVQATSPDKRTDSIQQITTKRIDRNEIVRADTNYMRNIIDTVHYVNQETLSIADTMRYLSSATKFYLQQTFANDLRTPSSVIERPVVHPDSQTWEDIMGVLPKRQKSPDWMKPLAILRMAATILGIVYLLFFD